jgi:hypothetical protein
MFATYLGKGERQSAVTDNLSVDFFIGITYILLIGNRFLVWRDRITVNYSALVTKLAKLSSLILFH